MVMLETLRVKVRNEVFAVVKLAAEKLIFVVLITTVLPEEIVIADTSIATR